MPPGDAFASRSATFVLPALLPGVIEIEPVIWTAPARLDGDVSVPCQRALTFASRVLTCTTGACFIGLRNGLHARSASAPVVTRAWSGIRCMSDLSADPMTTAERLVRRRPA